MTTFPNFVEFQLRNVFAPPVRSLMDIDFYKLTMGQLIFKDFRDVQVTFELINRDQGIPLASIIPEGELRKYLDHARSIKFTYTDIAWLRGMRVYGDNMFSEEYTNFLEGFKLPEYKLRKVMDQFELSFSGSWVEVSMWETIALTIISELYYRNLMKRMTPYEIDILYARAKDRLWSKLERLTTHPGVRFADFGLRRRHSFLWQEWVLGVCKEVLGDQFTGTSNTWMAFHHDLMPIGTNAHELPMVLTALANSPDAMKFAQYEVTRLWQELYGEGLRIFLPDTYGTTQFLENAPEELASNWRGFRQDSGDPIFVGNLYLKWLEKSGVDSRDKLGVFSDGLDVDPMIRLYEEFSDRMNVSFGWGTLLMNDFQGCALQEPLFRPFSMVCKVTKANGRPVVKLSDNIQKATGSREEIAKYTEIFGTEGQSNIRVVV